MTNWRLNHLDPYFKAIEDRLVAGTKEIVDPSDEDEKVLVSGKLLNGELTGTCTYIDNDDGNGNPITA